MDDSKLESVDDIDLERVVIDRLYRRRVIAFLNAVEGVRRDAAPPEGAERSPSS